MDEDKPLCPFSDEEIKQLRQILEAERNMKWLWSTMRNLAVWVAAILTGITVGYQALIDVVKHLAGK